jgi:hypothetical protein
MLYRLLQIGKFAQFSPHLTLCRHASPGEQLFEDYGDNSDRIYFQYHGFVPRRNPFRCIQIVSPSVDAVEASPRREELIRALRFRQPPAKCVSESGARFKPHHLSAEASTMQEP